MNTPSPHSSGQLIGARAAREGVSSCSVCALCTPNAYRNYKFEAGRNQFTGFDIHCGYFDRRVSPVLGCSKFVAKGGSFDPLPLEH